MTGLPDIAFDPLIALWMIIALGLVGVVMTALAGFGRLRSALARLLATGFIVLALLNPQTVEEDRQSLNDEVLILRDDTESVNLGDRQEKMDAIYAALVEKIEASGNIDVTTANVTDDPNGTRLATSLVENLGNLPQNRLAGVIALTDGQIHDLPENAQSLMPEGVPFHSLILDDPDSRDRRIRTLIAPRYGLVGEQAQFEVRVDDPGYEGERAEIEIKLNGELKAKFPAIIGNRVFLPLRIERRGTNTVELTVVPADNELTLKNNTFIAEISGIRDRMRVLLVTGEPHRGGRAWRNLLKSDPAVDLVQFTILTSPGEKNPGAAANELSLIQFPTRQLFEEKLDEFDLIIFDQFERRSVPGRAGRASPILSPYYIQNIAEYVNEGGALLVATGPAFATEASLFRSPLASVLPARPTGETSEYGFKPSINDKGRRHPVTAPFAGNQDQTWGRWFRIINSSVVSGDILMTGPGDEPLLVIEKVGDGRVSMLMSDQAWLWARNYDGGGPYNEIFRRLSHWLLGEPDLDAERLSAQTEGDTLMIERRTLSEDSDPVTVIAPDGSEETVTLSQVSDGLFRGTIEAKGPGAYRLSSSNVSTVTAIGALNPKEYSDLSTTTEILAPLSIATEGLVTSVNANTVPEIRRPSQGSQLSGESWLGLVENQEYVTRASRRAPLAPGWLYFLLAAMMMAWAWRREGR